MRTKSLTLFLWNHIRTLVSSLVSSQTKEGSFLKAFMSLYAFYKLIFLPQKNQDAVVLSGVMLKKSSVKNMVHTRPSWVRRMESLFMSLWITPCVCRTDNAFRTDRHTVAICSSFILQREADFRLFITSQLYFSGSRFELCVYVSWRHGHPKNVARILKINE